jgi:hypothetical protein
VHLGEGLLEIGGQPMDHLRSPAFILLPQQDVSSNPPIQNHQLAINGERRSQARFGLQELRATAAACYTSSRTHRRSLGGNTATPRAMRRLCPSGLIRAGHFGQSRWTVPSHFSRFSLNRRGLAYSAEPICAARPNRPNSGMFSSPFAMKHR